MSDDAKTYSTTPRLRRVTTENAYVNVPVTGAIMKPADDQGIAHVDTGRFVAEGIPYGDEPDVQRVGESRVVDPHPTRMPPPRGYPPKNQWASLRSTNAAEGE